jgi:signal transduction histidine kinase
MNGRSTRQYAFLAATTRLFALIALITASVLAKDSAAALTMVSIGCVWLAATAAERMPIPRLVAIPIEAALVGVACALAVPDTLQVLAALTFPPFTAGLRRGTRGAVVSLACELLALSLVSMISYGTMSAEASRATLTWVIFSAGLGLIGGFIHATYREPIDPLDSYRDAQALIRELIGLSDGLSRGLEPVTISAGIANAVHDELPVRGLVVHVPRFEQLTPIINDHGGSAEQQAAAEDMAARAFHQGVLLIDESAFALPLSSGAGTVAVVSGFLSPGLDPVALGLSRTLGELAERLEPEVVHLDTALLFAAFRDAATAEERRRLAREMHDGVAQEMASLGYLVDDMMAEATTGEQALRLQVLRERLSSVVGEVRQSVRTLRTSVGENESLGQAIGSLARHLSSTSGVPIQVTLDESTQRLRPEVEAELMRIAQEAMNNAVRHAEPSVIEVQCTVAPPRAEIVVSDDGHGVRGRREDSHGLEIMAERARLIEGDLSVDAREPRGTVVSVTVGGPRTERQGRHNAANQAPRQNPSGSGRVLQR